MAHLTSRRWIVALLIVVSLLVLTIYLLSRHSPLKTLVSDAAEGAPLDALVSDSSDASPLDAQQPDKIFAQGEVDFGPGSFNFLDPRGGLSKLSSYKAILHLSFDGTTAGQPSRWSKTYTMLVTKTSGARQLTIEKTGQAPVTDSVLKAEMDGMSYEWRGENTCAATIIEPGRSLGEQMEPASFLTGIRGAEEAGSETVNGVAANHYTFDERALGLLGVAKSTGEVWIASGAGYVVKYALTTKSGADYFGNETEGTATWRYELTDADQPITIKLPKDCPAGIVDMPRLPDATHVVNTPGVLAYTTSTSLADAIVFYQKQLPLLKWQPSISPFITNTIALLDFTRVKQLLSVILEKDGAVTTVRIVLGPSQR